MTAISHYYDYFHGQSTVSCTAHRMYDVFDTYDCYLVGTTIITVIIMVSLLFLMCTPYDCHIPQALCVWHLRLNLRLGFRLSWRPGLGLGLGLRYMNDRFLFCRRDISTSLLQRGHFVTVIQQLFNGYFTVIHQLFYKLC